ncbi:non-ribosomal peptide synthetase [Pseudonocardia sp. TRM90224]|uniref:non-ribosomal peptide synthetase n=1 Tax=Pseudonocardia sp. TRM90224 TaxID=2812678 RepID=UPI001E53C324|nr:amino acid adenylation domain-containing protein [Pseudonocardia sp. TRM90224]
MSREPYHGGAPAETTFPASFAQERIWLADQADPGSPIHNVHCGVRVPGADARDVLDALRAVVARHEALRTTLELTDGGVVQIVHPAVPIDAPVHDLRTDPDPEVRLQELAADLGARAIPTGSAPLWRARIVRIGEAEWAVLLVVHHAVFDAASCVIVQCELAEVCAAHAAGRAPNLPPLPVQYADYAVWHRSLPVDAGLAFWRSRLAGLPLLHPVPTDRARPAQLDDAGAEVRMALPSGLARAVDELASARSATPFTVLLAAYAAVLARHGGDRDVTELAVGLTVSGRDRPELAGVVGMFVNQAVARIDIGGDPRFGELVARVRATVLEVMEHGQVPFQSAVDAVMAGRDPGVQPLHQLGFNHIPESGIEPTPVTASRDDLEMDVSRTEVRLRYRTALFDRTSAEAIMRRYVRFLQQVVAHPERRIAEVDLLGPRDRERLAAWNATATAFPDTATVHGLVERQAASSPDAIAVVAAGGGTLTYRELDERANAIAHRLTRLGVRPGAPVAVHLQRSPDLVVALLGVLKAGAAYVPLDPGYPAQRLDFMLADSGAAAVITTDAGLPGTAVRLDPRDVTGAPTGPPRSVADPDDPAYLIYTSGSTGQPKGVPNLHRGVVNRLDWMQRTYPLTGTDAVLQKTPMSFDVSVWEFFWPLICGARLVLARPGGHQDPTYLREVIAEERITTVHFVPSMLTAFLEGPALRLPHLRQIFCSGEELPVRTALDCLDALPDAELHNLYGPTEAAVDVTAWHCTRAALDGAARVPLGRPIQNLRIRVVEGNGRPAPIGVPGELVIAGVGVAPGYHRRPELTVDRFGTDPDDPTARTYRTGDRARWRHDGQLDFLGRLDDQVKIRGVRIEPGEVAAALRTRPGVRDAAVVARPDSTGQLQLVGYVVPPAAARDLQGLRDVLPAHLIPTAVVGLAALPLGPNGKLDRSALPAVAPERAAERPPVAPRTEIERLLVELWTALLGPVGIDDDVVDRGAHSLLVAQLAARIARAAPGLRRLGVLDVFARPTVRALAAFLESADPAAARPLLHELTPPVATPALTCVCVPHGGASAAVFRPLAAALPPGTRLLAVEVPGHDVGAGAEPLPFAELVEQLGEQVQRQVDGPLALYGHCSGSAVAWGVARHLRERGRVVEAVCCGAYFPMAKWRSRIDATLRAGARDRVLRELGIEVGGFGEDEVARMLATMRADAQLAEDYFAQLLTDGVRIDVPVLSIVGSADPITDGYRERHREWAALADTVQLEVLDEAGHLFLRSRPQELAAVLATAGSVHRGVRGGAR